MTKNFESQDGHPEEKSVTGSVKGPSPSQLPRKYKQLKGDAKRMSKDTGQPLHQCHKQLAVSLGFKDFYDYQQFMRQRDEYQTAEESRRKKKDKKQLKNTAKRQGDEPAEEPVKRYPPAG